jgi:hypothetical protein
MRYPGDPIRYSDTPDIPANTSLRRCPTLTASWRYSAERLNALADRLADRFTDAWFSVALAGSYGRLDAGPRSDADFLILIKHAPSTTAISPVIEHVRSIIQDLDIPLPNPTGLFSSAISIETVTDGIGGKDDGLHDLARRMVLLLEAKCVYNEKLFRDATQCVLDAYMRYSHKEPDKQPLMLLNEIIRFFRSVCVNYEVNFLNEHEKWAIRNAKLRHSRVLMYFGLLSVVLNSSTKTDKEPYIRGQLGHTPLERICHVYSDCGESDVTNLLGPYNVFISSINDPDFRGSLEKAEYHNRYTYPEYVLMKTTSEALAAELTRFVLDRRGHWPNKILGYLLF